MTVLGATDLQKSFGPHVILGGVSFSMDEGERVGVVGRNGMGKSTLAKILMGEEPADSGNIAIRRGARVLYLHQEPKLEPGLTVRNTVLGGMGEWTAAKARYDQVNDELAAPDANLDALLAEQVDLASVVERLGGWERSFEVEAVLGHLGITEFDAPVDRLSGGQKRRVALARVLVGAPDLMILDEPTNHLDADTIDWLEQYLVSSFRGALLLVTHDRWLLDQVAQRTLEVSRGRLFSYDGGYGDYLIAKSEREALEERTERNRQNFLRTELEWLARQPKARTTKQKARIERAETAKLATPDRKEGVVKLSADVVASGKTILELRKLSLRFGENTLVSNLTLSMVQGERLGIIGPNGIGKSTLLRAIMGELEPAEGELVLGKNTKVAYLDQLRAGLDDDLSVLETVTKAIPMKAEERIEPRSYLERFLFDSRSQMKKVGMLSGGERARLCFARLFASAANLLLLDEPTNDLDTETLSVLEDLLVDYKGSVLVVTHDRYFLDRVSTGILAFEAGGQVSRYAGAYQAYSEARQRQIQQKKSIPAAKVTDSIAPAVAKPKGPALSNKEQKELEGIMAKIEEAENAVTLLEVELSTPVMYGPGADPNHAKTVGAKLDAARAELAKRVARWEELEEKKAQS